MCGKRLIKNMRWFLDANLTTTLPVTVFDTNIEQEVPFISVGFTSDTLDESNCPGHYTVAGVVVTAMNGHDYTDAQIDTIEDDILTTLSLSTFSLSCNYNPARPATKVFINDIFITGTERQQEGDDTTLSLINFEAFCVARDYTL